MLFTILIVAMYLTFGFPDNFYHDMIGTLSFKIDRAYKLNKHLPIQSQIKSSGIYIIKHHYDLNGGILVIPENTTLIFQGGEILNGIIFFQQTKIIADSICFRNMTFDGSVIGRVSSSWFDLREDELYDNSMNINMMFRLAELSDDKNIVFPYKKKYYVKTNFDDFDVSNTWGHCLQKGNIEIPSGLTIDLNYSTLCAIPNGSRAYNILFSRGSTGITIKNGILFGDKESHNFSAEGSHEWCWGISLQGCDKYVLENLTVVDCVGDGINLCPMFNDRNQIEKKCVDGVLKNIKIINSGRNNLSIDGVNNLLIQSCVFAGANLYEPMSGIDIEPNIKSASVDNVKILNCQFYDNKRYGISVMAQLTEAVVDSISIIDCEIYGSKIMPLYIYGGSNIDVSGCVIENVDRHGLRICGKASNIAIDDIRDSYDLGIIVELSELLTNLSIKNTTFQELRFLNDGMINTSFNQIKILDCNLKSYGDRWTMFEPNHTAELYNVLFERCKFDVSGYNLSSGKPFIIRENKTHKFVFKDCLILDNRTIYTITESESVKVVNSLN